MTWGLFFVLVCALFSARLGPVFSRDLPFHAQLDRTLLAAPTR
jgi:hypothetical protein